MKGSISKNPLLVVLTGPSGVGKDAVFARMSEIGKPYCFVVTVTTRLSREGEVEGVDYIFLTETQFREMVAQDELLEWAEVYGNLYGVPKSQINAGLRAGKDVIVKTDVQGVKNIKKVAPEVVAIFIAPPDIEELERRLYRRNTDASHAVELRLRMAKKELKDMAEYDHVVVNHTRRLDETVREVDLIIKEERRRVTRRTVDF